MLIDFCFIVFESETHPFSIVIEDPYYCGLSARVPKFDRVVPLKKSNKSQNVIVPKRMSVAYLQHPMIFAAAPATNGFQAVITLFFSSFSVHFRQNR